MSEKIEQLAKVIARHYTTELGEKQFGPCACNAPSCMQVRCSHFWNNVLRDPKYLHKAISHFEHAQHIMQNWEI